MKRPSLRRSAADYANKRDCHHGMLWLLIVNAFEAGARWQQRKAARTVNRNTPDSTQEEKGSK
jgi:hypothetical protein